MKRVKWTLVTGFGPSTDHSGELEVEDDATEEEIEEAVKEEAWNCIDLYWEMEG